MMMSLAAAVLVSTQTAKASQASRADVLIVVLSRTGNTAAVARMIQEEVGGDLVELELVTPYPKNYDAIVAQVERENETGYLPPLATKIPDIRRYKTVILGFPTWDMQLPPPMKSFLAQYDLKSKTVFPFNTNAGYGVGSSFSDVRSRATGARVLEGLSMEGGYEKKGVLLAIKSANAKAAREKVKKWLDAVGMR